MSDEPWFLGRVNRQKAEDILNAAGINGSFVVRSSESISGAYALSVLYNKSIHTYRILPTENKMLAVQTLKGVQQRKFATLNDMIREYRSPQNGLICGLSNPVGENVASVKFDNRSSPSRKEPPLPALPVSGQSKSLGSNVGIKVMPSIPSSNLMSAVPSSNLMPSIPSSNLPSSNLTAEKSKDIRNLPPVPMRETSARPQSHSNSHSLRSPSANKQDPEFREKLLTRFNEIRAIWPAINSDFFDVVHSYVCDEGLNADIANLRKGGTQCAELQALLAREAVAFQSELEKFLMKIDVLRLLFDLNSPPRRSHNRIPDTDVDLDTFLGRLGDCQTVVKSLNMRVCKDMQEQLGVSSGVPMRTANKKTNKHVEQVVEKTFEVKQESALKFSKQKLKLDIVRGRLSVIKGDGTTDHDHSKVLQIIKNKKSNNKVSIVFNGNKKRDYTFEKGQHREAFCQLMQHMRNKHSKAEEPDCVSIFCGSWNMGDAMPPSDISSWFMCSGQGRCLDGSLQNIPHDIYIVGTQETGMPEKDWSHRVLDTIHEITGSNYHLVDMQALWHIKIILIVKEVHKNRISHVQTSSVKTGIANALGNKGAVALSFQFGGTSFCFINAHLTSGAEKCGRRNQNYHDILRSLNLGKDTLKMFELTNRFDHLFFFGDLNYRLDMDVREILDLIKYKKLSSLASVDQLRREKDMKKAFVGFDEEELFFPPTYRYERGTREVYAYLKVKKTGVRTNVPSWCDRVLWRSYPETHNVCLAYGCSEDIMTSDHSPIFSNFEVGVKGQYVSNEEISSDNTLVPSSIIFFLIHVELYFNAKNTFYLQFHSDCLTSSVKSSRGDRVDNSNRGSLELMWSENSLPALKPMISDREYLTDQHILFCVCSEDDNEVIGECVISLRSKIEDNPQQFQAQLMRKGEEVGLMQGQLLVKARDSAERKEKTYDFIRRDDEEIVKRELVDEANYSDVPFNAQSADQQINKFGAETAPCSGSTMMISNDGEYANPDEIKKDSIHISNSARPPIVNPSRHAGVSSPRKSSPQSPRRYPTLSTSVVNGNTNFAEHFEQKPSVRTKPSIAEKPIRILNNPPMQTQPNQKTPPYRPKSPSYPLPVSSAPLDKSTVFDDSQFDEVLAEFSKVEKILSNIGSSSAPNTPSFSTQVPQEQLIYQIPSSLPVQTSNETPNINRTGGHSNVFGSPTYPLPTSNKFPSNAAYPRRPTESRPQPTNVDEFLRMINLEQYSSNLEENGWDSLEFLGEITEDDLYDAGITDPQHCRIILEHIQALPL